MQASIIYAPCVTPELIPQLIDRAIASSPPTEDPGAIAAMVDRYIPLTIGLWAATVEGVAIAMAWVTLEISQGGDRQAHLFLLHIDPPYQGRGLGKHLMGVVLDWARSQGFPRISLQVAPDNQRAIALYSTVGFNMRSITMGIDLNH